MLKRTITYKNFDGDARTKDLYFNITKSELLQNMDLREEVETLAPIVDGPERELASEEIKKIFATYKRIVQLAYGERRDNGDIFAKSDEIWKNFEMSAAYDAFIWDAFTGGEDAFAFISEVLPKDLRDQAAKEAEKQGISLTTENAPAPITPPTEDDPEIDVPGRGKMRLSQLQAEAKN